jgi:hypothetical protein
MACLLPHRDHLGHPEYAESADRYTYANAVAEFSFGGWPWYFTQPLHPETVMSLCLRFLPLHRKHHQRQTCASITLKELVFMTMERQVTDPRDRTFALLGLVRDGDGSDTNLSPWTLFQPDYTMSLSWAHQKATLAMFSQDGHLNLLLANLTDARQQGDPVMVHQSLQVGEATQLGPVEPVPGSLPQCIEPGRSWRESSGDSRARRDAGQTHTPGKASGESRHCPPAAQGGTGTASARRPKWPQQDQVERRGSGTESEATSGSRADTTHHEGIHHGGSPGLVSFSFDP